MTVKQIFFVLDNFKKIIGEKLIFKFEVMIVQENVNPCLNALTQNHCLVFYYYINFCVLKVPLIISILAKKGDFYPNIAFISKYGKAMLSNFIIFKSIISILKVNIF